MSALLGFSATEVEKRRKRGEERGLPSIQTVQERDAAKPSLMGLYEGIASPTTTPVLPEKKGSLMEAYKNTPVSENYYIKNEMKKGLVDIATLPGLVPDAVVGLANILTEPFRDSVGEIGDSIGGTRDIAEAFKDSGFVEELEPPSDAARYKGAVARYSVPTLVTGPFIATLSGLSKAQKAGAILVEALSGIGGGLGSEGGADLAESIGANPDIGRAIGGVAGSLAPTTSLARVAVDQTLKRGKQLLSDEGQVAAGKSAASKMLSSEMNRHAGAEESLKNYDRLKEKYPEWDVSIGAATDAPGILSVQSSLAEKSSEYLEYAIRTDREARKAISNLVVKDFPEANNYDLANASSKLFEDVIGKLDSAIAKSQAKERQLVDRLMREVPKPEQAASIGVELRALRETKRLAAKEKKNMIFGALYQKADDLGIEEDVMDVISFVEGKMKSEGRTFQDSPAVYKSVMDEWGARRVKPINPLTGVKPKEVPVEVSFEELHSLMKRTNAEYGAIKRGTDETRKRDLLELSGMLKKKLSQYEGPVYKDFAADFKAANKFYQSEYQDVFFKGPGGGMIRANSLGDITPDESIVRNVFLKDKKGAAGFRTIYGNDAKAQELLLNGILDVFRKDVVKDGVIQTNKLHTFNKNYGAEIAQYPEINRLINNSSELAVRLADRQAEIRDAITKTKGSVLKKLAGVEDVDSLLNTVIKSPKAMGSLMNTIGGSKEGMAALAHTVAVKVSKEKDPFQFLLDNKKSLKPILDKIGPGHAAKLEDIAEMMSITNRFEVPKGVNVNMRPKDMVEEKLGTSGASIFSQLRFAQQGKMSYPYIMVDVSSKLLFKVKREATERLLNSAFYDPKQAKFLLDFEKNSQLASEVAKAKLPREWAKASVIVTTPKFVKLMRTNLFLTGALSASRANQFLEEDEEF